MLNTSTLTLFLPHLLWWSLPSIWYLSKSLLPNWLNTRYVGRLSLRKQHRRAVHLGPSAGWSQDWRWPKARRTESCAERSAARCFPFLCLRDVFLPGRASGSRLRRPRGPPSVEDVAQQKPISLTGGRWGMWRCRKGARTPSVHPSTALKKLPLHTAPSVTGSVPPSFGGLIQSDARRVLGLSCVCVCVRLLDQSLQRLFQTPEDRQRPAETRWLFIFRSGYLSYEMLQWKRGKLSMRYVAHAARECRSWKLINLEKSSLVIICHAGCVTEFKIKLKSESSTSNLYGR